VWRSKCFLQANSHIYLQTTIKKCFVQCTLFFGFRLFTVTVSPSATSIMSNGQMDCQNSQWCLISPYHQCHSISEIICNVWIAASQFKTVTTTAHRYDISATSKASNTTELATSIKKWSQSSVSAMYYYHASIQWRRQETTLTNHWAEHNTRHCDLSSKQVWTVNSKQIIKPACARMTHYSRLIHCTKYIHTIKRGCC